MSGISSKNVFALKRDLRAAIKQTALLREGDAALLRRLVVLENRTETFWGRLRWLVVGR